MARFCSLAAALLLLGVWPVAADQPVETNLEQAAHVALDGPLGDVAAVGTTVIVTSAACPATAVVVDAKDPKRPKVTGTIALPPGTAAGAVAAAAVETPQFTGDLAAIALTPSPCGSATPLVGGAVYFDVTEPATPRPLGRTSPCPQCGPATPSVALAQRPDGRAVAVRLDGPDGMTVDDVSDPARPAPLVHWSVPRGAQPTGCVRPSPASSVALHDDGRAAVVAFADGRVFDLDLSQPGSPVGEGSALRPAGTSTFAAVLPLGRRTLAVVAEERGGDACPGESGLRVLELSAGAAPVEIDPVRFTTPVAPGRVVASGELAYVAWHGDGLRVVDLSQVKAVAVAQFKPAGPAPDVVGVALLPENVVVTDRTSGLYVLQRPDEGAPASTWWSQVIGVLPYLLFALIATAVFVVPRLAMGRVPVGTGVPGPVPERIRQRRRA